MLTGLGKGTLVDDIPSSVVSLFCHRLRYGRTIHGTATDWPPAVIRT